MKKNNVKIKSGTLGILLYILKFFPIVITAKLRKKSDLTKYRLTKAITSNKICYICF